MKLKIKQKSYQGPLGEPIVIFLEKVCSKNMWYSTQKLREKLPGEQPYIIFQESGRLDKTIWKFWKSEIKIK